MKSLLAAILFVSSLSAFAADPKAGPAMDPKMAEMMKKMKAHATPGEQHKMLAGYAGNWTYTSKMWHKPDATAEETTGAAKFEMVLEGRQLKQEISGTAMGMPFSGLGFVGYNNSTKEFESTWMDTFSTGSMHGKGKYDKSKKTLTESGQYYCPIKGGMKDYRTEWTFTDKNSMTFSMYGPGMNGEPEFKHMEMVYKRAK